MTTEIFIDLDRDGDGPAEPEPESVGAQDKRHVRAVVLAIVAALLLGLPTLSTRPRPLLTQLGLFPRPTADLPRPGDGPGSLRVVGDALIAIAGGAVTAFNLDGTTRWSYRSEGPEDFLLVDYAPVHEVFLVLTMKAGVRPGGRDVLAPRASVALDPSTGRPRWRIDGSAGWVDDLIVSLGEKAIQVHRGDPPALQWQADGFVSLGMDRAGKAVWGLTADRTLSEMDLATGAVRQTGKMSGLGDIVMADDRVFIVNDETVSAYRKAGLERLDWNDDWMPMGECGPVLCVGSRTGSSLPSMGVADPQTGKLLWQLGTSDRWLWPTDTGLLAVRPYGPSGMATLAGLVDPMTGEMRVRLDDWQVISPSRGDILVRHEQDRMHFARLTPDGPRLLGSVPHRASSCSSHADVVACELSDGRVGVWQLTP